MDTVTICEGGKASIYLISFGSPLIYSMFIARWRGKGFFLEGKNVGGGGVLPRKGESHIELYAIALKMSLWW